LLGLAGVLKTGRGLTAPISIDGTWKVEADMSRASAQPCGKQLAFLAESSLVISQSGKNFVLMSGNMSNIAGNGVIDEKNLSASVVPADSSVSGCASGQYLTLTATVDPRTEPRTLTGHVSISNCSACTPLEFRAVRLSRARSGGGAH